VIVLAALGLLAAFLGGYWLAIARTPPVAHAPASLPDVPVEAVSVPVLGLSAVGYVPLPDPSGPEWQVEIWTTRDGTKAGEHAPTDDTQAALRGYHASYTTGHTIRLVNRHTGHVRLEREIV
jgi:hypothetical protein